jgi:MFS superfamily sulfate permease-like transporter
VIGGAHRDRESQGLARSHRRDGVSLYHRLPGLQAVSSYQRRWLARDVAAGVVLTTLLVPQGMAYAELAGLPPITGLYTSIVCLLSYAVFGPSRILVLGPDSALGPMIAATIPPPGAMKSGRSRWHRCSRSWSRRS